MPGAFYGMTARRLRSVRVDFYRILLAYSKSKGSVKLKFAHLSAFFRLFFPRSSRKSVCLLVVFFAKQNPRVLQI